MPDFVDPFVASSDIVKDLKLVDEALELVVLPISDLENLSDEAVKKLIALKSYTKEEFEFKNALTNYEAVKGDRQEGDIALTDPYWEARNRLNKAHRELEESRKK